MLDASARYATEGGLVKGSDENHAVQKVRGVGFGATWMWEPPFALLNRGSLKKVRVQTSVVNSKINT